MTVQLPSILTASFGASEVTFLAPTWLWLLLPAGIYCILAIVRRTQRLLPLLIRTIIAMLLVLSLAEPARRQSRSERSLSVLVDLSQSVPPGVAPAFREQLEPFFSASPAMGLKVTSTLRTFFFGRDISSEERIFQRSSELVGLDEALRNQNALDDTGATDLERSLRSIITRTDAGNILLLSDGQETEGDAAGAAVFLKSQGVRVYPLIVNQDYFTETTLRLSHLDAPLTITAGQVGSISAALRNSSPTTEERGMFEIWLGEKKLFAQRVQVPPGQERAIAVPTGPIEGGLHRIRAVLKRDISNGSESKAEDATNARGAEQEMHRWIAAKERARLLLLSGAEDDRRVLKQLYALRGYTVEDLVANGKTSIPVTFEKYSGIIINNVSAPQLPSGFLPALKRYVEQGGGLLLIGGDRSYGLGRYINTPLEEISPLKFVPPKTTQRRLNSAVILVIDKSRSMLEQGRIEAAKRAALLSINSLKDDDLIGVIGFDSAPFVIIRLAEVSEVKPGAERRLRNLTAAGRTNLLPALAAARNSLVGAQAGRKHIIVLSDGEVPDAGREYTSELSRLNAAGITLTAVALGATADIPFLQSLSNRGKGAFYHTLDPTRLPEIFVHDIRVTTGEKTMKERSSFSVERGPGGLRSTTVTPYPELRGYVETIPKEGSQLELLVRGDDVKPLLASWKFGAGKVIAFTSDANGRWSLPWLSWAGFSKFWTELTEEIQRGATKRSPDVDFDLRYRIARNDIELDLTIFDPELANRGGPAISAQVTSPGGEMKSIVFQNESPGRFLSLLKNARPGDYRLQVKYGSAELPAIGITLRKDQFGERSGDGINYSLLSEIARLSGGKINPSPSDLDRASEEIESFSSLVPHILSIAFFLTFGGIFVREWLQSR